MTAPEPSKVRLTEDERTDIASNLRWHFAAHAAEPDKSYDSLGVENAILRFERALAARLAEVAQPAGETRVEWGVKCDHGMSTSRLNEQVARSEVANAAGETCRPHVVSRTVTSFLDVVGEWTEVAGDE